MAADNYVVTFEGLTLDDVLQELESEDPDGLRRLIYITPPDEGADTEVDSDKSDDEAEGDVNHLGRNMLRSICEVQTECTPNVQPQLTTSTGDNMTSTGEPKDNMISTGEPEDYNYVLEMPPSISRPLPTNENMDLDNSASSNLNPSESLIQVEGQSTSINTRHSNRKRTRTIESDSSIDETENVVLLDDRPTVKNKNKGKKSKSTAKKTMKEMAAEKKKAMIDQWKPQKPDFKLNLNCDPIPCSDGAMECETPLDFFLLFFSDDLLDYICEQSNLYALQKNVDLNLTRDELWVFFGGLLMSGYAKYPNKRMYWSTDDDVPKLLSQSIRCNRFEQILRYLHLNDNTQNDKSDKLLNSGPTSRH
ncbi:chimeric ERCC6-PGBD3 protein-like [Nilaparvata lugens]|uniref:chimeric ERCC6-PGBD3 protein-like n=1 Tax=Nilaparvata lugens TaxID=108931 RepID=UPI00193CC8B8|nr:chimeric ERCC6-PGBD3 protein-like [Nilaparvata lugens]